MKRRQLRVKTGVVVPSRPVEATTYVPAILRLNACPNGGCGHCWFCRKANPDMPESHFEHMRQRAIVLGRRT